MQRNRCIKIMKSTNRSLLQRILNPLINKRTNSQASSSSSHLTLMSKFTNKEALPEPHTLGYTDVAIIGGGLVGLSTAYWLSRRTKKKLKIAVIERDYGYSKASTVLSLGGIRHQFSIPENVQMSMFTSDFLLNIREHLSVSGEDPPDAQFQQKGYLFLTTEKEAQLVAENIKMQKGLGAKTEMLSKSTLSRKFPWINLEGIECGSFGNCGEGWFDPWLLLQAMKKKNLNMGVRFINGEVVGFGHKSTNLLSFLEFKDENGQQQKLEAGYFVNCAGPWAGEIASMAGVGQDDSFSLPVEPRTLNQAVKIWM